MMPTTSLVSNVQFSSRHPHGSVNASLPTFIEGWMTRVLLYERLWTRRDATRSVVPSAWCSDFCLADL